MTHITSTASCDASALNMISSFGFIILLKNIISLAWSDEAAGMTGSTGDVTSTQSPAFRPDHSDRPRAGKIQKGALS